MNFIRRYHWAQGSYIVEGSVIYPLLFFIICIICSLAVTLYHEIEDEDLSTKVEEVWIVKQFYQYDMADELLGEIKND